MIRLRVVSGGRRVGQVPPSYQNRQISALDETADAPQSSLLFISVLLILTCSFIFLFFFHFLSFSGAQKICFFFWASISLRFLLKFLLEKNSIFRKGYPFEASFLFFLPFFLLFVFVFFSFFLFFFFFPFLFLFLLFLLFLLELLLSGAQNLIFFGLSRKVKKYPLTPLFFSPFFFFTTSSEQQMYRAHRPTGRSPKKGRRRRTPLGKQTPGDSGALQHLYQGLTKDVSSVVRCSMEMWCLDDIGRDCWDWVGPPTWERA